MKGWLMRECDIIIGCNQRLTVARVGNTRKVKIAKLNKVFTKKIEKVCV